MKQRLVKISKVLFASFLLYLVILIGGFFGIKYGFTNTPGAVDKQETKFEKSVQEIQKLADVENVDANGGQADDNNATKAAISALRNKNYCRIGVIGKFSPVNARKILEAYQKNNNDIIAAKMILAVDLRLNNALDFETQMGACDNNTATIDIENLKNAYGAAEGQNIFPWMNDSEWDSIRVATAKDQDAINRAAAISGIEPRLIVSSMIVEQLRLFHSQRELFKKVFEPLKILGNATKISLGVMGIKEATAIQIENNLKDPNSPYYLGIDYGHALDFTTDNLSQERYARLTNERDHYYSYLYAGFYLREMIAHWKSSGYDISYRPEIIDTLFNVGFPQCKPNPDPKVGGSEINVGSGKYSFGSLSYEFYYSGEMLDEFPYVIKE